jgi:hypothetical protein
MNMEEETIMKEYCAFLTLRGTAAKVLTLSMTLSALLCTCAPAQSNEDCSQDREYSFDTVKFPGDTFTQLLGINAANRITGYHGSNAPGHPNKGFTLSLPKEFTPENFPKSTRTQVFGIDQQGSTDGFYVDAAGRDHGFLDINGVFSTVDFPGTPFNQLLGLNNHGQAAGYYADSYGINFQPYIYDRNGGVFLLINIPTAVGGAQATGINDRQDVSGLYIDSNFMVHGFLLDRGTLKTLDYPGSIATQAMGINDREEVVGLYVDRAQMVHGFVYCKGHFQSIDDPNGTEGTTVNGINDQGWLVGFYYDSSGNTVGMIARPVDQN